MFSTTTSASDSCVSGEKLPKTWSWRFKTPPTLNQKLILIGSTLTLGILLFVIAREVETSRFQAGFLSSLGSKLHFSVHEGRSDRIRFPKYGPYDIRLGYTRLPQITRKLSNADYRFSIAGQSRISPTLATLMDRGIFGIYREKTVAGLSILDMESREIYRSRLPERTYGSFSDIPPLVLNSLLYIENRELLDADHPYRNPAVEWDRFALASLGLIGSKVFGGERGPGGSTIATQLEKYRHSPEGRTSSPRDKLQQMASASVRAYLNGPETLPARQQLVTDYINSIPLAAIRGFGEVNGLGDGMWAWFDAQFEDINRDLRLDESDPKNLKRKAQAFVQVLSLFLAHRRPSELLLSGRDELRQLVTTYLNLLAREGIISSQLKDAALNEKVPFRSAPPEISTVSFLDRKAANSVRTELLTLLDIKRLYELDRFDLEVKASINGPAQDEITATLRQLRDKKFVQKAGLVGHRVLETSADPGKVMYSFTLYEKTEGANVLRVETDNLDQPLNINKGVKLDLGSTAKLRTLITYLEIITSLFKSLGDMSAEERAKLEPHPSDKITQWAISYLNKNPKTSLREMLDASMNRTYSANPHERFFTGGGLHSFENFKAEDNGKVPTLWEGMRHSVNLVFIRLMRDIVSYYMYRDVGTTGRVLEDVKNTSRREYLSKFADKEGTQFLNTFYQKYKNKNADEVLDTVLSKVKVTTTRYAAVLRAILPEAPLEDFSITMRSRFPKQQIADKELSKLYHRYDYAVKNLPDRGYIAKLHPLEIWLAGYLLQHPKATREDILKESTAARQEVYNWLFASRHKSSQNTRIRIILETEAFREIHRAWKRLGYPFDFLVPSYATSIGSSADKPAALAELMGILVNSGVRVPTVTIEKLHFAKNTPYETILAQQHTTGEKVLEPEITEVVREALTDIVERGTAVRLAKVYKDAKGQPLTVGGKTGTGDHRYETFGAGGRMTSSRVVNRTATFAFFIGERFFGTVTAFVPGEDAAKYKFTSALPVQLLKYLAPVLSKYVQEPSQPSLPDTKPAM